jgi:lipopolysaccharide transport system permease protein
MWKYAPALDLFYFLAFKDIKLRYRQTLLGMAWVLGPILAFLVVFTVVFTRFIKVEIGGVPYVLFLLSGLTPWTFFQGSVSRGTLSVVSHAPLIKKVAFPRALLPLAPVAAALADLFLVFVMFSVLAAGLGYWPSSRWIAIVPAMVPAVLAAAGLALGMAALNVFFRDVQQAVPIMLQIGLFATPIIYPLEQVPQAWQSVYALNPLVGVIAAVRYALLGQGTYPWFFWGQAVMVGTFLLVVGYATFRATEWRFADVI